MSLRISLLLILAFLVACGKTSDDDGMTSGSPQTNPGQSSAANATLIEPVSIQGNFQNLNVEQQQQLESRQSPPPSTTVQPSAAQNVEQVPANQQAQATPAADEPAFVASEPKSVDSKASEFQEPSAEPFIPATPAPPRASSKPLVLDENVEQLAALDPVPLPKENPASNPPPPAKPLIKTAPPAAAAPATDGMTELEKELLRLINAARATKGIAPVKFSRLQSNGSAKCIGSQGHSEHMAFTRNMSHDQFPADICLRTMASSENVGYADGEAMTALRIVHKIMMDEGPGPGHEHGHYMNIMNPEYNTVGLGFYYDSRRRLWMTENFLRL